MLFHLQILTLFPMLGFFDLVGLVLILIALLLAYNSYLFIEEKRIAKEVERKEQLYQRQMEYSRRNNINLPVFKEIQTRFPPNPNKSSLDDDGPRVPIIIN